MRHVALHHHLSRQNQQTGFVAWLIFLFLVFDGLLTYIAPLLMTERGLTQIQVGYLLGFSSVAGLTADIVLGRVLHNMTYRRIFFVMLLIAASYPLLLLSAHTIGLFLVAMATWGLYWDFLNIGQLSFVSTTVKRRDQTPVYGLLHVSITLGGALALLLCGVMVPKGLQTIVYAATAVLFLCCIAFIGLHKAAAPTQKARRPILLNMVKQFALWRRTINRRSGILFGIFYINLIDAAFWQIGPQLSQEATLPPLVRSFFMVPYQVTPIIAGVLLGSVLRKKRSDGIAKLSLFIACMALAVLFFTHSVSALTISILTASFFLGLASPTFWSSYAHVVESNRSSQVELETLGDACTNFGYVVGPISVGYAIAHFGLVQAFGVVGLVGCILLAFVTFRH